jgi:hypothetical protein
MDRREYGDGLKSIAISFLLLIFVYGRIWFNFGPSLPAVAHVAIAVAIFAVGTMLSKSYQPTTSLFGAAVALIVLHIHPIQVEGTPFYSSQSFWRSAIIALPLSVVVLLLTVKFPRVRVGILGLLALFVIVAAFAGFSSASAGRTIFSDDHPAFLYRLHQLKESFPLIPFYNPSWNGGVEAREFFPSGALGLFLLWFPLIYFFDLWSNYNLIVTGTLFLLVPVLIATATFLQSRSITASLVAGIVGVTASALWYRWALSYGTLPFLLSMAALPVVVSACRSVVVVDECFTWGTALLLFASGSLAIFWPLSGVVLIPLLGGVLLYVILRRYRKRPQHGDYLFYCTVAALFIVHLPWILIFASASKIFAFVSLIPDTGSSSQAATHAVHAASFNAPHLQKHGILYGSVILAREFLRSMNPLLLLLVIPAVARSATPVRMLTGCVVVCSIGLAVLGPILKPQLELQRFWFLAAMVSIPVVAERIADAFARSTRVTSLHTFSSTVVLSLLLLAPHWLSRIVTNESDNRFYFEQPVVKELAAAIDASAGSGRAVFSGFVLHELNNGHLAPLPILTKVPLVASSYQHDKWRYTESIPPEFIRAGAPGVTKYLDYVNATVVLAHHPYWKKWFRQHKDGYSEIGVVAPFVVFRRIGFVPSYFESGSGEILEQSYTGVRIIPATESVTLRFNYLPLLVASSCQISPKMIEPSLTLIHLSKCTPGEVVTISMKSPVARLLHLLGIGRG